MESSLISIVVPVYNVENHLDACIQSIVNQSYKNIEIILVNDGSTDSSPGICKRYLSDQRIHLIEQPNEGLSSARQAGMNQAHGKYLCMIDSDDYIEVDFVKKMYARIDGDRSDICVCATRFYADGYNRVFGFNENIKPTKKVSIEDIEYNYCALLGLYYMSDSWNKIYRMEFIKKTGVTFNLQKPYNGTDLLFNHRLMLHLPQISVLNEPLYNHQLLDGSRVHRKNKQLQKGFMIIMNQIIQEAERLNYSDAVHKQLSRLYVMFLREAAQDIFNQSRDIHEVKDKFDELHAENKCYLMENPRLRMDIKQLDTISLRMFCYCLNSRRSNRLFRYLNLRRNSLRLLDRIQNIRKK